MPKKFSWEIDVFNCTPVPEPPNPAPILKFPDNFSSTLITTSSIFFLFGTFLSWNVTFSIYANFCNLLLDTFIRLLEYHPPSICLSSLLNTLSDVLTFPFISILLT